MNKSNNEIIERIKNKLQVHWEDKLFYKRVFKELESAEFKKLSFISDILDELDTSHLTGYTAIIAQSKLRLDRETNEIQFYKDLFTQLDRDKLIHFLAWAVASKELDESVIYKIVPKYSNSDIKNIVENWGAEITDNVEDCPKCHNQPGYPSGRRRACISCAKESIVTKQLIQIPSMMGDMEGFKVYLCNCEFSEGGYHPAYGQMKSYNTICDFHK
jgi:hypothetical protein